MGRTTETDRSDSGLNSLGSNKKWTVEYADGVVNGICACEGRAKQSAALYLISAPPEFCDSCFLKRRLSAHYEDCSKPSLEWLCRKCHIARAQQLTAQRVRRIS